LSNAEKSLTRLHRLKGRLEKLMDPTICMTYDHSNDDAEYKKIVETCNKSFEYAMDDDFNTPEAIAVLFEFVNASNKFLEDHPNITMDAARNAHHTFVSLGKVLTLFQDKRKDDDGAVIEPLREIMKKYDPNAVDQNSVDDIMERLLEIRKNARREKQWNVADSIRDDLSCLGFEIQDTAEKTFWRKR